MSFNASVNLGTVGNGILGQTVSISGCTGTSCTDCSPLASTQAVSSFPKTITGIPDGTVSLYVKVDGGDCVGTTQCISITGIPNITPTPTSTIGATSTPTSTPTSTYTPTSTITETSTITPSPSCITGDYTSTGNCSGSNLSTFTLNSGYSVVVKPQGYFYSGSGTRYAYAFLRTNTGVNIQQFTLTQVDGNTPTFSPTEYTLTTPGTYQLYVQQVDCNQGGTGGSGFMYLDATDCQPYTATLTPTPTTSNTTMDGVTSGSTLNEACAGGGNLTLYFYGASIQIGESLYTVNTGGVLSQPVPAGYYYYPSYNTIYNVTNGSTGAVASTPTCPAPTPITTFLGWDFSNSTVIGGPLAITLADDPVTACTSPEYVIGDGTSGTVQWYFSVYGSNITNATEIVLLSSGFRSELTLNGIFYVRQRISGTFYYRRFQLQGSPGDTNVTALPTDISFTC